MKKLLSTALFLFGLAIAFSQASTAQEGTKVDSSAKTITASEKWLLLPVKNGGEKRRVVLKVEGEQVRDFDIELAQTAPDWYAYLDISPWKGKELELQVASSENPVDFELIAQSSEELHAEDFYKEPQRGQFHFSPKRGWNNDPNGLVYYKGEYHLFFQHNPYGVQWGNMHWGHAVSRDLVHWKELEPALYPDEYGTMFSGGAVVDVANTSGFGTKADPPLVLFYTAEGSWIQGLAHSIDGRNFEKIDPIVEKITDGNRDPKVIWHEPTQKWVMVVYVTKENDQHTMHFFTSPDLKAWELASVFNGGIGDDRYLFECPEFFELPVVGNPQEKKWILTGANSEYAIGTFDGKVFTPEVERLNGQLGRDFYAAQTFSNEPQGRRVEIGWWRTHTSDLGANFNQSMSIPMELKLVRTPEGLRLTRTPVEELKRLRGGQQQFANLKVAEGEPHDFDEITAELLEINASIAVGDAETVRFRLRGVEAIYDINKEELTVDGVTARVPLSDGQLELHIFVDRTGLEIFSREGLFFMPININIDSGKRGLQLAAEGGDLTMESMEVYALESAWK